MASVPFVSCVNSYFMHAMPPFFFTKHIGPIVSKNISRISTLRICIRESAILLPFIILYKFVNHKNCNVEQMKF